MAFATNITTTTELDDSLVTIFSDLVYFSAMEEMVIDQLAVPEENINGKTVHFSKYTDLSTPTALTEDTQPTAQTITDTGVDVTPVEEGKTMIVSRLANFQTGGKADRAAALAIGRNMGKTQDVRGIAALEGGTPVATLYPNAVTAASNLSTADILDKTYANRLFNKLARRGTPAFTNGLYASIAHDDVLYDLRDYLQDISKFGLPETVTKNAIGVALGFIWYRDGNCTITANASGTIDAYKILAFGSDVLVRATSKPPGIVINTTLDPMARFAHISWYGVFKYGILDGNNMVHGVCASSVGAN